MSAATVDMAGAEIAVGDEVVVQGGELDGRQGEVVMVPGPTHPGGRDRVRVMVQGTESPAIWFDGCELLVIEQAYTPLEAAADALNQLEHGEHADMYEPPVGAARAALTAAIDAVDLVELFAGCRPHDESFDCVCGLGPTDAWATLESAKQHQAAVIAAAFLGRPE
jgi:hypothetical protein